MTTAEQSAIYAMRIMDQDKEIRHLKAENARLKAELEAERACQDCREYRQMMEARLAKVIELHHNHNGGLGVLDGGPSCWCKCCGELWPCPTVAATKGE